MSFTNKELRAIRVYSEENGYKVQLSAKPWVNFTYMGEPIRVKLSEIVKEYEMKQKQQTRNRARQKRFLGVLGRNRSAASNASD